MRRAGLDEAGRNREIENPVVAGAGLIRDLVEASAQLGVIGRAVEAAAHEAQQRREAGPILVANRLAGKFLDAVARERAILLVVEVLARKRDYREVVREQPVDHQIVERGQELAMTQVAGAAEDAYQARRKVAPRPWRPIG